MNNTWHVLRTQESESVCTVRVNSNGSDLSVGEVLERLLNDEDFRLWFSKAISDSKYDAFYWEATPISEALIGKPFEFAQTLAKPLIGTRGDPKPFSDQFEADSNSPILAFKNLSGDAVLVVPRQLSGLECYGHLASFLKTAPQGQVSAFWKKAAETIQGAMQGTTIWLSTAGLGVSWLHLRVDSCPKYFRFEPYKKMHPEFR